jgi:PilZ domain-containing protein
MDPSLIDRPVSGQYRIACGEPCEVVSFDGYRRQGTAWDVSVAGVYVAVPAPFPHVGRKVLLTFALRGDPTPITCECRVQWHNRPSVQGGGIRKPVLPPGCGVEFVALEPDDAERIEAHVRAAICLAAHRLVSRLRR